jgi:CHAD domain-containing protein
MGSARDWDVFKSDLLEPVIEAQPNVRALRTLRRKAETRARQSYRQAQKAIEGDDYTRFALRFGQWLESRAWQLGRSETMRERGAASISVFAAKSLKKRYARVLADGKNFADLPVAARHELRITLKKCRYTAEFFAPLFTRKATKPFVRALKDLQDDLGHMNDIATAEMLLADLLAKPGKRDDPVELGRAAGLVIGWHARGVADLDQELVSRWEAFKEHRKFWT